MNKTIHPENDSTLNEEKLEQIAGGNGTASGWISLGVGETLEPWISTFNPPDNKTPET